LPLAVGTSVFASDVLLSR